MVSCGPIAKSATSIFTAELLVAPHNAVTKITEVKELPVNKKFYVVFDDQFLPICDTENDDFFHNKQINKQIETNKHNINNVKIDKIWRIALMHVALKKDDL